MTRGGRVQTLAMIASGALLLAGSHALAWWWGSAVGEESTHQTSNAQARTPSEREDRALLDLLQQRRAELAAEARRKQEQSERERIEAEHAGPGAFWKKRLAAGRAKLEADKATAAELEAILEKVAEAEENDANVDLEDLAALELWLERDADTALAWLSRRSGYGDHSIFSYGLARWLAAGDCEGLAGLLERYPGAARQLVAAAAMVGDERGADFALTLAATLEETADRQRILDGVVYGKDRKPENYVRVLALLKMGGYTGDVLEFAANSSFAAGFAEEMRKAGLPELTIEIYGNLYAAAARRHDALPDSEAAAARAMSPAEVAADLADATDADSSWHSNAEGLGKVLPDFDTWCREVQDRRMSPQELMEKARAVWPAAGEHEAALRTQVFRKIFNADPVGSMQWWQESGQEDLPGGIEDGVSDLSAEQIEDLLEKFPHFMEPAWERAGKAYFWKFMEWERDYPEGYRKAVARLKAAGAPVPPAEEELPLPEEEGGR